MPTPAEVPAALPAAAVVPFEAPPLSPVQAPYIQSSSTLQVSEALAQAALAPARGAPQVVPVQGALAPDLALAPGWGLAQGSLLGRRCNHTRLPSPVNASRLCRHGRRQ